MKLSLIMPVLNEADIINGAIDSLLRQNPGDDIEIIVVDGDPNKSTIKALRDNRIIKISSPPGRGIQMNKGAQAAQGDILFFLHSDTILPRNGISKIINTLKDNSISGGAFDLSINAKSTLFRVIEKTASLRSRFTKIPFGDQGIFIRKFFFTQIGEYKEIPIMEDVDLMRRVKKNSGKIKFLNPGVSTSPRRWQKEGTIYCTLKNWVLLILYFMGVSPFLLARFYK